MSALEGQCHCGAVRVSFETALDPDQIEVRACQCTFCRHRGAKTVSDPAGRLDIAFAPEAINRYRFGTQTSDFIICRTCGDFLAAVIDTGEGEFGVLNVVGAGIPVLAARDPSPVNYDGEDAGGRLTRRQARWTPVRFRLDGSAA
jgi:hypothetical protein